MFLSNMYMLYLKCMVNVIVLKCFLIIFFGIVVFIWVCIFFKFDYVENFREINLFIILFF